ncbi:MAG: hypothetical protein H0X33_14625 [Taibaiella sp.]|nr:hypothetical protein [Taibaiella sp.]
MWYKNKTGHLDISRIGQQMELNKCAVRMLNFKGYTMLVYMIYGIVVVG